jgi:hypothetical protein
MRLVAGSMRTAATQFAGIRRGNPGWRSVAGIILLLAFTLQSFVTQIHMHGTLQEIGGGGFANVIAKAPGRSNSPIENGTVDCPLCQAVAQAGAFFAPAAPLVFLPAASAECAIPFVMLGALDNAVAHYWCSRAPPRY